MKCPHCGSEKVQKKGFRLLAKGRKQLYKCTSCKVKFSNSGPFNNPQILCVDIETSKIKIKKDVYRLGKHYIGSDDIVQDWYVLSWAAKWLCNDAMFSSVLTPREIRRCDDRRIVRNLWQLFDSADIIIGHNLDEFDLKKMNWRFIYHGMRPPQPYKTVDTLKVARQITGATSKSLRFLADELELNGGKKKLTQEDYDGVMNGNPESLIKLREYNEHDVLVDESLYFIFRPWMRNHPNMGLYYETDELLCKNCGSTQITLGGTYSTPSANWIAWTCACGAHGRTNEKLTKKKALLK